MKRVVVLAAVAVFSVLGLLAAEFAVAADAPGCREVVRHGENGVLVPMRDARALAEALRELLTDPGRRARMGARGRELAETEFAKEIAIRDTIALYEQCAGSAHR